jgi:hypothetical protein
MARRRGSKFPLIVYQHMVGRWWTPMIAIGLGLFALAYLEWIKPISQFITWRWQLYAIVGVLAIFTGIFFLIIKQFAYVQPFPDHLRFVTPFLQMNISYKRIHRTIPTEMRQLFPLKSMSGWVQEIFSPLAGKTALVIELKGYPISPTILRLFLSRFFFKDKTPHLVILVKDWMKLSTEMESMKTGEDDSFGPPQRRQRNSILSKLPQK